MQSQDAKPIDGSRLKPLRSWNAALYPLILLIVAVYTASKDFLLVLLPRRRFSDFQFEAKMFGSWVLGEPVRVLVVDDCDLHREVSHRMLQKQGSIADFAGTAPEAIEACRRNHYDLVLMDIQRPGISGLEATQGIRRESVFKHVLIIAVTDPPPFDKASLVASGLDGFMKKRLIASELQRQLPVNSARRHKAS